MKRRFCALALAGAGLSASPALGQVYGWDGGGGDSSWSTDANWRNDTEPPQTGSHDVNIKASNLVGGSPQQVADWDYGSTGSCGTIEVVSNGTYAITWKKSGSGAFSVSSTATFTGADSTHKTTLDADAALTLPGVKVESYVVLDVASSVTVDANGALALDALTGYTECEKIGSGSFTPDTIDIDVGDASGEAAMLIVTSGALNAVGADPSTALHGSTSVDIEATLRVAGGTCDPGDLILYGGNSTSREAVLEYASGTLTAPDTLSMYGYSRIDADESFDVDGDFTVGVAGGDTFATDVTVDIASLKSIEAAAVVIGDDTYACTLRLTGTGVLETNNN